MKKLLIFLSLLSLKSWGQVYSPVNQNRILAPALPFMNLTYDARSGALGDAGVAISPDANSGFMNAAKYPFLKDTSGVTINYTPWLSKLINDMGLYGLNAYRVSGNNGFGLTMKYFDAGKIEMRDAFGNYQGEYASKEFSIAGTFSKKLSNKDAVGIGLKYIHSNLAGRLIVDGVGGMKPANAVAGDIYYFHNGYDAREKPDSWLNWGAVLSNIGSKINYGDYKKRSFQPTLLKVGLAQNFVLSDDNVFTLTADAGKLLIPTPAVRDASNQVIRGKDEEQISGMGAIFQSWASAPDGFSETLKEITYSFGAEFCFKQTFSLRGGYFTENKAKGDRKYFTLGVGIKDRRFGVDFSYLIPTASGSPLANTWRLSLVFHSLKK